MTYDWFPRTLVPIIVGTLLGWLAKQGLQIDEGAATVVVTGLLTGIYVLLARMVEGLWPQAGRLMMSLGLSKNVPAYVRSEDPFLAPKPPVGRDGPAPPGAVG